MGSTVNGEKPTTPALYPSDGERVPEGRVRGQRVDRGWRPLAWPARLLIWVLIPLMALPSSAWACADDTYNDCATSEGGGSTPASDYWSGEMGGASTPYRRGSHDPINLGRMSTYMWATDVETAITPGGQPGAALRFTRFNSSDDTTVTNLAATKGPLGWRWTHNFNVQLAINVNTVRVKQEDATIESFTFDGTSYNSTGEGDTRLTQSGSNFVWQVLNGTRYTFDSTNNHRLFTIEDAQTNRLTLSYNASSLLTNVADQFGRNLRFTYNASNLIAQVIDPLARTNSYFYDDSSQLTNVVDSIGPKDVYTYDVDGFGRVATITNPRGKTHTYVYDVVGKVTSETNAAGAVMTFSRDDVAHTVATTDRNGNSFTDAFNTAGRQLARTDIAGSMSITRDDKNRPTVSVNRLGFTTYNTYAANGCGCEFAGGLVMSIDPLNRTNLWEIETNYNKPITFTNALGNITRWAYDARGNLTNTTDALTKVTRQIYDTAGNLTQVIDANNRTNKFGYDSYGSRTNVTDALGNPTRFKYDIMGRATNSIDALNRTNSAFYDARDRVVRTLNPLNGSVGRNLDGNGNLAALTNELTQVTSYTYDNVDRLSAVTLPAGGGVFTSYAYDPNGNRIAVTNALNNRTAYGFDTMNRMTTLTNALNKVWSFDYDAESRMLASTDANSHATTFGYDAANQLTSLTNALTQVIQFQYDLTGNRTNIIDGRGNSLGFRYDAVNRLTNLVYAASDSEKFAYDAVGNLTNYITRAAQSNRYVYDAANRLTNITYVGGSDVISFGYDAGNQLTNSLWKVGTATNSHVTFRYDLNGRLTNETQKITTATTKNVGYGYDAAGRRTRLTYPDGTFITYQYNANGWLTNIANGGTNSIVAYTYDAAGRRTKRHLENNTFTVYDYDNADQMTNIWHRKISSGVTNNLSQYQYGYDDAGNRTWVKRASGKGDVFKYDDTDQLTNVLYEATNPDTTPTAATNEMRYVFDEVGNRTSMTSTNIGTTTYVANALNQYTNVGGTTMKYDGNGNPTNVVENGVSLSLSYDRENRLTKVVTPTVTVTNVYDAFNRLIERQVGTNKMRFVYDNQWRVVAEYDQNDALLGKYVYGPEIDEPVKMTRGTTRYYFHAAALGTITEVTSFTGFTVESYSYDVYGSVTVYPIFGGPGATSLIGNRFMFQGRDRDPDTRLYNVRNRYYSPTLGRFLQVDPVRHDNPQISRRRPNPSTYLTWAMQSSWPVSYNFVENNPVGKVDPSGKGCTPPGGAWDVSCAASAGAACAGLAKIPVIGVALLLACVARVRGYCCSDNPWCPDPPNPKDESIAY